MEEYFEREKDLQESIISRSYPWEENTMSPTLRDYLAGKGYSFNEKPYEETVQYEEIPMLNLKEEHAATDPLYKHGMENTRPPEIMTLEEKARREGNYDVIMQLAGLAVRDRETAIKRMDKSMERIHSLSLKLNAEIRNLQEELAAVKQLATIG